MNRKPLDEFDATVAQYYLTYCTNEPTLERLLSDPIAELQKAERWQYEFHLTRQLHEYLPDHLHFVRRHDQARELKQLLLDLCKRRIKTLKPALFRERRNPEIDFTNACALTFNQTRPILKFRLALLLYRLGFASAWMLAESAMRELSRATTIDPRLYPDPSC